MTGEPTTLIVIAVLAAGGAIFLAFAWRRGARTQEALRDKRAADRARYARLTTMPELPPEPSPRATKRDFGRR